MTLTYGNAKEDVRAHLWAKWQDGLSNGYQQFNQATGVSDLIPPIEFKTRGIEEVYVPELRFSKLEDATKVDTGRHFGYFRMDWIARKQSTMRGNSADCGIRYTHNGIVTSNIYMSRTAYRNDEETFLVEMCLNIFQRKKTTEDQVWFRNPRPEPLLELKSFYLIPIFVEFQFDEIQN